MSQLSFSVITVSFNHGEFIRKTIDSVLAQNYPHIEHIIVDGGSTDQTLDILKEYDHLKWTSEPDRGQTHALEKGFRRATGDIIAWLNSDDFYEPNVFKEIAQALENYPTLLTKAGRTDRAGEVQEIVPNIPRNFFDLLKFWMPYAWLAQTGVFFKRSLLEEVKRADGSYLDESLYYTMDYDLWLRIARRYPFTNYLDKTCAYFRMYEDNKTGKEGGPTQKECARVYRRHRNQLVGAERQFSFLVLTDGTRSDISQTLNSIVSQQIHDSEIILVGYGPGVDGDILRSFAIELDEKLDSFSIRHIACRTDNFFEACNEGIAAAAGNILTFLRVGDSIPPEYTTKVFNYSASLLRGIIYPFADKQDLLPQVSYDSKGLRILSLDGICRGPLVSSLFSAHKACLLNIGSFSDTSYLTAVRKLLLSAVQNSWHIEVDEELAVAEQYSYEQELDYLRIFQPFIAADLIVHAEEHNKQDVFKNYLLKEHNSGVGFDQNVVTTAQELLANSPPDWKFPEQLVTKSSLEELVKQFPLFSPAWELLRRAAAAAGNEQLELEAKQCFTELRQKEPFGF